MNYKLITATLFVGALLMSSCSDVSESNIVPKSEISADVSARITALGFNAKGAVRVSDGYLVENDLILTDEVIKNGLPTQDASVPKEEQYRTTAIVTGLPRVIKVKVSALLGAFWITATDNMIARYNALGLRLTFQRVTSGTANVNIILDETLGLGVLGVAGFPSRGNPFSTIRLKITTFGLLPNAGLAATVLAHEMGHCIGFRHTDYMARVCDKLNEGAGSLGAILIPGTSATIDTASWMISCAGRDVPFSSMDVVALNSLYK
jgi:hypothetical protein